MEKAPRHLPVLKTDCAGRVQIPRDTRRRILEEFDQSGLSGLAFAALVGVKYSTFAAWRRRRGLAARQAATSSKPQRPPEPIRFVEAHVPTQANALELELEGRLRLRLSHASQIPLAVQLIRQLGPC